MAQLLITLIIELLVIAPIILIASNKAEDTYKCLLLFVAYFFFYACLLNLPNWFPVLKFMHGNWNWSGKLYAIAGSILFYQLFKTSFSNYHFITFKQRDNTVRTKAIILLFVFLLTIIYAFWALRNTTSRLEDLLFQSTMPGLDEELAFRGIMLGLLSNALIPKVKLGVINLGNPALLITAMLFGLGHSLHISPDWDFHQNWMEFINTFVIGWLLGWMTLKSGSILMPILTHNLLNVLPMIVGILLKKG